MRGKLYVYVESRGLVEVERAPRGATPVAPMLMLDSKYADLRATDGTDIGSRRKHREYMRLHNLAHVSDYEREFWPKKQKERDAVTLGEPWGVEQRRQDIRDAFEKVAHGHRPRRQSAALNGEAAPVVDKFIPQRPPKKE